MTIEIVDFPINSMVIFNSYVKLPGRVNRGKALLKVYQSIPIIPFYDPKISQMVDWQA